MNFLDDSDPDPPLRALRAFEATARLGTMAAAAQELAISPSAVSHQLSFLEDFLRLALLKRLGRGVQLTDAGREYYRSVRAAFAVLRDATGKLRDHNAPMEARLSVIPLFATGWLIAELPNFISAHPNINVNITYANHQNYFSDAADLSVRFGDGHWNGYSSTRILSGSVVPVCSQAFLQRHGPFETADLLRQPLIHDQDRSGWSLWFESCGLASPPSRSGSAIFEDGQLAVSATLAGLGIALLRPPLIAGALSSGVLVQLDDHALDDGRHYFLCERIDGALTEPDLSLRNWLIAKLVRDE
jgi:DNA-binding transcriptional LysR family regulator